MHLITIKCAFCAKPFSRSKGQANEANKFNWKQFCSSECLANSKITGVRLLCSNPECTKSFFRVLSQIKKFKKSYCSRSCSAIVRNQERPPRYPPKSCAHTNCITIIPHDRKYCSPLHMKAARKVPDEILKKYIINSIKSFYKSKKRIPVKREMYGTYKKARMSFGTWNNAVAAAGFKPNPVLFAEKQIANDGHHCDSLAEKIIDDLLASKGIAHQRSVPYPNDKRLTADFVIGKRWIEFFGLAGEIKNYDHLMKRKREIAKKNHIRLIELYPRDLFPKNQLQEILKI